MTKLQTYSDAELFLNGFIDFEKTPPDGTRQETKTFDLDNFRELLRTLGDPHLKYAAIHVAGTKGKGSTCAFLAGALQECGLKVGLYTSPHITRFTERIQIDGRPIPDSSFCALLEMLGSNARFQNSAPQPPNATPAPDEANTSTTIVEAPPQAGFRTVFELLTAAAFMHFAQEEVDIVVIETGLGGRLDCTNVFDVPGAGPLVDVITAIGLDHTAILGNTIPEIAAEKAAIIRPHALVVMAPQRPESYADVQHAVEARLTELGLEQYLDVSALVNADEAVDEHPAAMTNSPDKVIAEFTLGPDAAPPESILAQAMVHGLSITTRMPGAHQLDNIRTCLATLLALENAPTYSEWAELIEWRRPETANALGRGFPADSVRSGIAKTRWPGRFEIISRHPLDIVDGSHCLLSCSAMADTFNDLYGVQEAILICGFLRDKDPTAMCAQLRDKMNVVAVMCVTPPGPRGMPASDAAQTLSKVFPDIPVEAISDPADAIQSVTDLRDPEQAIVVFGSLYLVSAAKAALREHKTVATGQEA